jgi:hypothetical protein
MLEQWSFVSAVPSVCPEYAFSRIPTFELFVYLFTSSDVGTEEVSDQLEDCLGAASKRETRKGNGISSNGLSGLSSDLRLFLSRWSDTLGRMRERFLVPKNQKLTQRKASSALPKRYFLTCTSLQTGKHEFRLLLILRSVWIQPLPFS